MVEQIVKKSKFISMAFNVLSVNQVEEILMNVKNEHKKATHICYAYNVNCLEKCCDDGEPSGTAGLPILNVITKNNLKNVLVVVVRYFGGVKLGAGGLVRAYSSSATLAVKNEDLKPLEKCDKFVFKVDFSEIKLVETISQLNFVKDVKFNFGNEVYAQITVKSENFKEVLQKLSNLLDKTIDIVSQQEILI